VTIGNNNVSAALGCKRSLAGPKGQSNIDYWPTGPATD